jgi:hypothetical protein
MRSILHSLRSNLAATAAVTEIPCYGLKERSAGRKDRR